MIVDEGCLFGVPLGGGKYGVGLAARIGDRGMTLGYFSGQLFDGLPSTAEASFLPHSAIWIALFGDLEIMNGRWPVLGKVAGWDREVWPLPDFGRTADLSGRHFRVSYMGDIKSRPMEIPSSMDDIAGLPEAGTAGAGFVENRLRRLLGV